jgi:hypothetical protein
LGLHLRAAHSGGAVSSSRRSRAGASGGYNPNT